MAPECSDSSIPQDGHEAEAWSALRLHSFGSRLTRIRPSTTRFRISDDFLIFGRFSGLQASSETGRGCLCGARGPRPAPLRAAPAPLDPETCCATTLPERIARAGRAGSRFGQVSKGRLPAPNRSRPPAPLPAPLRGPEGGPYARRRHAGTPVTRTVIPRPAPRIAPPDLHGHVATPTHADNRSSSERRIRSRPRSSTSSTRTPARESMCSVLAT